MDYNLSKFNIREPNLHTLKETYLAIYKIGLFSRLKLYFLAKIKTPLALPFRKLGIKKDNLGFALKGLRFAKKYLHLFVYAYLLLHLKFGKS